MRVPLSWLKEYVEIEITSGPSALAEISRGPLQRARSEGPDIAMSPEDLAHMLTMAGLEVEAIEYIGKDWGDKIIAAQIVQLEKVAGSDHLSYTKIDTGSQILSVICGAPNIQQGDKVPLALAGAQLGDITISETQKMGYLSQGMLCSLRELGIGSDHSGIYILDPETKIGTPLVDLLGDVVLEFAIKAHRSDLSSIIGIAREVAALTGNPLHIPQLTDQGQLDSSPVGTRFIASVPEHTENPLHIPQLTDQDQFDSSPVGTRFIASVPEHTENPLHIPQLTDQDQFDSSPVGTRFIASVPEHTENPLHIPQLTDQDQFDSSPVGTRFIASVPEHTENPLHIPQLTDQDQFDSSPVGTRFIASVPGYTGNLEDAENLVKVTVEDPDLCPRYSARVISNVKIGPSPSWMGRRLLAAGMRPINNIVDITNYVMLEFGQPLHGFDYDRVPEHHIIVRRAHEGETMTTLDNVKRKLTPEMLLIADPNGPTAIAGVMGGAASEVSGETTTILLEAANFLGSNIRRTSTTLGLRTDASSRFEKGLDPELVTLGANRAAQLMAELAGGTVLPAIIDCYPKPVQPRTLTFSLAEIEWLTSMKITRDEATHALQALGFSVIPNKQPDSSPVGTRFIASVGNSPTMPDSSPVGTRFIASVGNSPTMPDSSPVGTRFIASVGNSPTMPDSSPVGTRFIASVGDSPTMPDLSPVGTRFIASVGNSPTMPDSSPVGTRFIASVGDEMLVTVPTYRTDIEEGADLVEEVIRLIGYDKIPSTIPTGPLPEPATDHWFEREQEVRTLLIGSGLNEIVTYTLTSRARMLNLLAHVDANSIRSLYQIDGSLTQSDEAAYNPNSFPAVTLANSLSNDLEVLRLTLMSNLLETVQENSKRNKAGLRFFESGRRYLPSNEKQRALAPEGGTRESRSVGDGITSVGQKLPDERRTIAIALCGPAETSWIPELARPADFYDLKGIIEMLLAGLNIKNYRFTPAEHPTFHPGRCAHLELSSYSDAGEEIFRPIGILGEVHPIIQQRYDLPHRAYLCELDLAHLYEHVPTKLSYQPISRHQELTRDLALVVDQHIPAQDVQNAIFQNGGELLRSVTLFDVYTGEPIPVGKKNLTYALVYQAQNRTLTDGEANTLQERIIGALNKQFAAILR